MENNVIVVELLLQTIDKNVKIALTQRGWKEGTDYNIYRYVDDIFIFTNDENLLDSIISIITIEAEKYLIHPMQPLDICVTIYGEI